MCYCLRLAESHLLEAGRIWQMRRDILHIGTDMNDLRSHYTRVILMMYVLYAVKTHHLPLISVESGALYCLCTVLLIATHPLGLANLVIASIANHFVVSANIPILWWRQY
jgi:hypothetical protein